MVLLRGQRSGVLPVKGKDFSRIRGVFDLGDTAYNTCRFASVEYQFREITTGNGLSHRSQLQAIGS